MVSFLLVFMIHITVITHEVLCKSARPTLARAGSFSGAGFTLVPPKVLQVTWWDAFPKQSPVSGLWQERKFVKTPRKTKNHVFALH